MRHSLEVEWFKVMAAPKFPDAWIRGKYDEDIHQLHVGAGEFLAAAGEPEVKEKQATGRNANGKAFKV